MKTEKTRLRQFQLFIFYKPACLQKKKIRGRLLSLQVFSSDGQYGISARINTIASRGQIKPIRIGENLVLNYNEF